MGASWANELISEQVAARRAAAQRLAQGPPVAEALPLLVRAAGDEDPEVREWAVAALEDGASPPAKAVTDLSGLLAATHDDVAYWAATLLGRLESAAAAAVPALAAVVGSDRSLPVRQRAAWALGRIGPPAIDALPDLEHAAREADPRLARLASAALAAISGC